MIFESKRCGEMSVAFLDAGTVNNLAQVGGCGHFSVPLGCEPEASSILIRAHPSWRFLEPRLIVIAEIAV